MPPYQSLSITTSDTLSISYNLHQLTAHLAVLEEKVPPRLVFEIGRLKNGLEYSIQVLGPEDYKAVQETAKAASKKNPGNLVDRSDDEIIEMLKNDHVLGLVVNGRLASVGAIALIDDETKEGRGKPLAGYEVHEKAYFKMAATHPDMEGLEAIKKLFPYRLAIGISYDQRLVMAMKTINPEVAEAYIKNGWALAQRDKIFVEKNGKLVEETDEIYVIERPKAIKWLKDNRRDIYDRLPPADDNTPQHTIEALKL